MQNPAKAFDKAKNTWEEQVIAAMEEQSQIDHSAAHSILEVQVALAGNLYIETVAPLQAAAKILAKPQCGAA